MIRYIHDVNEKIIKLITPLETENRIHNTEEQKSLKNQ
jgi:hypothetical protein